MAPHIVFKIVSGPNKGDSLQLDPGTCRLVGRHLADNETALMDRDGNRILDSNATSLLGDHLKEKAPQLISPVENFSAEAFERGPDVIIADESISRAHAMIFCDGDGVGIIDLASTNGTFVNAARIGSALMGEGDTIDLGKSKISISLL
ncbi:FHA domain-containing protein [Myxococcota bacterium]|nr:FHA domain-containing protein [Myxococcota bacterium]